MSLLLFCQRGLDKMSNREFYDYDFRELDSFRRLNGRADTNDIADFQTYSRDVPILDLFGCGINPLFADWIEIALAAYFADRVSCRDPRKYHREQWQRRIRMRIPVRSPSFWRQTRVSERILELLGFLTDDEWELDFDSPVSKDRYYESQRNLPLGPSKAPRVALFSGGLDSFAGSLASMQDDPNTAFLLVSCVTNTRQLHNQQAQVSWLSRKLSSSEGVIHQPIHLGFRWMETPQTFQEASQRTRGFLFLTLGSIAAINAGATKLELYENGIGALNLPYDGSQISAMSTRSVSPLTLLMMERLVAEILDSPFEIVNPFLFSTKGQMCSSIKGLEPHDIIPLTFSCDGFPVHESGKPQCGVCTSCLLRRLSLAVGNMRECDPGDGYGTDLFDLESSPSFGQLVGLRAMDYQVRCIREQLSQERPWSALSERFPQLQLVVSELTLTKGFEPMELCFSLLKLYRSYCDEWLKFPATQFLDAQSAKATA